MPASSHTFQRREGGAREAQALPILKLLEETGQGEDIDPKAFWNPVVIHLLAKENRQS